VTRPAPAPAPAPAIASRRAEGLRYAIRKPSRALPTLALVALCSAAAAQPPAPDPEPQPTEAQAREAAGKALRFLLSDQNADGSWGSQRNAAVGIDEFWSNVETHRSWRVATTGLACMAMLQAEQTDEVRAAYLRGVDWLVAHALVKRPSDWDVDNTWGYLYGLAGLTRAHGDPRLDPQRRAAAAETITALIGKLAKYQSPDGGWGYYDAFDSVTMPPSWSTSFMTAAVVLTLIEARNAGFDVPAAMLEPAVKAVRRCRLPNGAYAYSVDPVPSTGRLEGINQVKGSLGRIQVCNLALRRAGDDISDDVLRQGLAVFFREHRFLDIARLKPIPHEAYYANSGYFYFFGHHYAALVVAELPAEERAAIWPRLRHEIIKTQEADGSMWDYQLNSYTRPYAAAFGVMALSQSLPEPPRPAGAAP
jgi:hypothetical protein